MSKKIIIASIVLAMVLVAGFRIYFIVDRKARDEGQKPSAASLEPSAESSEPIVKLVYVGTNETLSEALYKFDLQDGKLDEPHIVHRILGHGPRAEITKRSLQFIGLNGETKKEIILESKTSKMDIVTIHNGKYAKVMYDFGTMGDYWSVDYYDVEGNLIFRKRQTDYWYELLADGKTLLRYQIYMEKLLDNYIYLVDLKENVLAKIKIGDAKWIGLVGIDRSIGDKFLLLRVYLNKRDAERWILMDAKGKVPFVKDESGYETYRGVFSDDTIMFVQAFPPAREKDRTRMVIVLNSKGEEIDMIKGYGSAAISPDQKWLALLSDDHQQILLISTANPKENRKIMRDGLFEGRVAEVEILNRDIVVAETIEKNEYLIYIIFKDLESRKIYSAPLEQHSGMLLLKGNLVVYDEGRYTAGVFEEASPYFYIYELKGHEKI